MAKEMAKSAKRRTIKARKFGVPDHYWSGPTEVVGSFVSNLGALTSFADPPHRIEYPHSSAADALRGDWLRIGQDMKTVIERENGPRIKKTA